MTTEDLTLADVCSVITDGAHNSPKSVESGGLPMASVKDLTPSGINLASCRHISEDDFHILVRQGCKPLPGDVLIAKDGATALDTVCVVKEAHDVVLLSSVAILRPDPNKIRSHYLRYFLEAPSIRSFMKGGLITGAAIPRVVLKDFKRCPIPVPDLKQQEAVGSILSAYDDLIENNNRRIKILEDMAQIIYREWFVNFRFPGHEKVRMVESELGPIPEGWQTGILRDVCDSMDYGYTASASVEPIGPKFLRITDIVPSVIDWHTVPHCASPDKNADKYELREGDIVVARTGATTGYAKRLNKRHPTAIFASYLVRLRINPNFSNHLFGVLVESDEYKRFIQGNWSGAAQPQANAQVLTSIPIVIAPEPLHKQFSTLAEPHLDLKETLQFKNLNLRTTRDLLLPKLISGEIPVEAADDTAAELMEEIALHA